MRRILLTLSACFLVNNFAHAQSEVFVCVDENGHKEYKNTGTTKGCRRLDLPGITVVPAPNLPKKQPAKSASSPADFPKVDDGTQKARDSDRRQILQNELKNEEQKLADLKKEYNNGEPERRGDERNFAKYQDRVAQMKDSISRSEKNIEALQRELGNQK